MKKTYTEVIFEKLEKIRKSKNNNSFKRSDFTKTTIFEFSEELDMPDTSYNKRKAGNMSMTLKSVMKLEKSLGVKIITIEDFDDVLIKKVIAEEKRLKELEELELLMAEENDKK